MTTVAVGGMVAEGDGELSSLAVVLLHGLGGTANSFQPPMRALAGHRAIRLELPGAGRAPRPEGALSIAALVVDGDPVADVRTLRDKARLLAIMTDGKFHKAPRMSEARQRLTA